MHIKRYNEDKDQQIDISNDRIKEMVQTLSGVVSDLNDKYKQLDDISNELENYVSGSKKENDQIDDSVISMETVKSKIQDSISQLDSIIGNLNSYDENGRKFLY